MKNQETNLYKTFLLEFKLINEILPNYTAFSIQFFQTSQDAPVESIQNYFNQKILTPPFKPAWTMAFFNMISISDPKMLREFSILLDYELVNNSKTKKMSFF